MPTRRASISLASKTQPELSFQLLEFTESNSAIKYNILKVREMKVINNEINNAKIKDFRWYAKEKMMSEVRRVWLILL
jgi:hypothetical protein